MGVKKNNKKVSKKNKRKKEKIKGVMRKQKK